MATLTAQKIKNSYKDLLQVSNSNAGIDTTIRYVEDGEGTASVLGLSTTGVTVNGTFKIATGTVASGGAYTWTFPAFSGTVSTIAGTETLTNKTIAAPVFSGSFTGTYTLAGTPTITAPTITSPAITGTTTIGSGCTITAPTITAPTITGTGTIADGMTLTTPKIVTSINDSSGNEVIKTPATASAVNEITVTNAATGTNPIISATGGDTNIGLNFQNKGSSNYNFLATADGQTVVNFYEGTGSGTNKVSLYPQATMAANYTVQFKAASGFVALDSTLSDAWTAWTPGYTGFSANPSNQDCRYKLIGKTCFISMNFVAGTSNATGFTITGLPFTSSSQTQYIAIPYATDAAALQTGNNVAGRIAAGTTVLICALQLNDAGWTNSSTKGIGVNFCYEIA